MQQERFPFAEGILAPASRVRRRVLRALVKAVQEAMAEQLEIDWTRDIREQLELGGNEGPLLYIDMPRTRGDCRGPGICPVFRCRHNLALNVKESGAIKAAGGGDGTTLRRAHRGKAAEDRMNDMVEVILARAEALGTLCSLDLAEQGQLTMAQIGDALGVSEEIVRQQYLGGVESVQQSAQIEAGKKKRAEQRAESARQPHPGNSKLVQIRRKK